LELDPKARRLLPLAAEAARHVGNPRVRNRGTFGGSLAHADPAAELPVVAVAHGGEVVAHGPGGERRIPLAEFFLGYLETALGPDEVLVAVELERPPERCGVGFHEEAQRADDFALAWPAAAGGVRYGCGEGVCGACPVVLGAVAVNACSVLAVQAEGAHVETVSAFGDVASLHPLQQELIERGAVQCGFCTPGVVLGSIEAV